MTIKESLSLITVAVGSLQIGGAAAAQFLNDSSAGSNGVNQSNTQTAADWLRANSWISVPVIALLGWVQTWLVAAFLAGSNYGFVADRRYAGLAKRTVLAAALADSKTCGPRNVIGVASMDPGLSSQLRNLHTDSTDYDPDGNADSGRYEYRTSRASDVPVLKPAGFFTITVWLVQLAATLWATVQVILVWTQEATSGLVVPVLQLTQLFAALTVNRGVWAIAVTGALIPGCRLPALYITTAIAVALEIVCVCRAGVIAHHVHQQEESAAIKYYEFKTYIICYLLVGLEAFVLIMGWIAAAFKIKYLGPWVFLPGALWLALGPIAIAVTAIVTHYK